ncbi:hypothetical protein AB205_0002900 [Aquarana catesbeiana]|uniref:Uncharacterized protein n=1 Tax=Aquarana catesbeiana TaxID=8400 RepID=A0A2G9SD85_AQUCT|nr:hypothetical protein AB205_0002900 [Aquarana catesbeiana]
MRLCEMHFALTRQVHCGSQCRYDFQCVQWHPHATSVFFLVRVVAAVGTGVDLQREPPT